MNYLDSSTKARYRSLNLLGLMTCGGALFFAVVYLQQRLGLAPCSLCMTSRLVLLVAASLFLLAWLLNPRQFGQRCFAITGSLLSLFGIGLNLYHIWLQDLKSTLGQECIFGAEQLLRQLPLDDRINAFVKGSRSCVDTSWQLLGLSTPQLTLLVFIVLLVIQLIQFRKKHRSYFR